MLYAIRQDTGEKGRAEPAAQGACPWCSADMIAKCGEIMTWHWAHVPQQACEYAGKGETEWHLEWKTHFPPERTEVRIKQDGKIRIADALNLDGETVEFQHSSISVQEIRQREEFHGHINWVFDLRHRYHSFFFKKVSFATTSFWWSRPWKSITQSRGSVFLDFGDEVFQVEQFSTQNSNWGIGRMVDKQAVIDHLVNGTPSPLVMGAVIDKKQAKRMHNLQKEIREREEQLQREREEERRAIEAVHQRQEEERREAEAKRIKGLGKELKRKAEIREVERQLWQVKLKAKTERARLAEEQAKAQREIEAERVRQAMSPVEKFIRSQLPVSIEDWPDVREAAEEMCPGTKVSISWPYGAQGLAVTIKGTTS